MTILANIYEALKTLLLSIFNSIIAIPSAVINLIFSAWDWFKTETMNAAYNFVFDQLSSIAGLGGFTMPFSEADLSMFATNVNVFFPVDDLISMGIFLLDTWVAVKLFRMGLSILIKFFRPSRLLTGSS